MTDYDRIAEAISFISSRVSSQPPLNEIAAHVHLSPFHFQRLFCRWAGVTPKRFMQVLTLEHAKQLLNESRPILEVSNALGLSSSSRLYDHFVQLEAMTPGEFKMGGSGLTIDYGVHGTSFGDAFIATTSRGVCDLGFVEYMDINSHLAGLKQKWPHAEFRNHPDGTLPMMERIFKNEMAIERPLSLYVSGTNFQINVWKALLAIPPGTVATYTQVANAIGYPHSARAVGRAIGANPVAFLIPCHRVIQQSGKLGGYHWGETRKHAMLAWEAAWHDQLPK
jgi:AraC family transcriptional regulator of adaptative response/methylated-DNA-[protein]-cysteine methyltransferase